MIWGHPHFTTPPSIIIIQHDHGLLEIPTYSFKSIIADCSSVKSSSYASMSYDRHPRPVFQVVSKSPVASCFNFRMKSHVLGSDHKPRDQGHSPTPVPGMVCLRLSLDASDVPDPGPSGHEGGAAQWPAVPVYLDGARVALQAVFMGMWPYLTIIFMEILRSKTGI